jgi:hypothetical protein
MRVCLVRATHLRMPRWTGLDGAGSAAYGLAPGRKGCTVTSNSVLADANAKSCDVTGSIYSLAILRALARTEGSSIDHAEKESSEQRHHTVVLAAVIPIT